MFTPNINRAPFNLNLAPQAETSAPVPPQAPDTPRMVQYWRVGVVHGEWPGRRICLISTKKLMCKKVP